MDIEAKRAALAAKREESARRRKDRDELEEIEAIEQGHMDDEDNIVVRFPQARDDLPGIVVARPIRPQEMARLRAVMLQDSNKPGAVERKAKLMLDVATACRLYPSAERLSALAQVYPDVHDQIGGEILRHARAGAESEGKG
jgi:cell envelope opacity-associated protein A